MGKSKEMVEFLDVLSKEMFGRKRSECIEDSKCTVCGGEAGPFLEEDDYSAEYSISGMCHTCQDDCFKDEYDNSDEDCNDYYKQDWEDSYDY